VSAGQLAIIGTPIGNLKDLTFRALEGLKEADVIYCEDTRRTLKLLNAYEIRKPLKSCPHFKEKLVAKDVVERVRAGERVAYVSDAGMPGLNDPGSLLVAACREENLKVEVLGGVSALTHFVAGEIPIFTFVGFLPSRIVDRQRFFSQPWTNPFIFFESPHRIESTLGLLKERLPSHNLILGKELSKISEAYFRGTPEALLKTIPSYKGEWIGVWFPDNASS